MKNSNKKTVLTSAPELKGDVSSVPAEKLRRFLFPARNGKKAQVVLAKNLAEATEKYNTNL